MPSLQVRDLRNISTGSAGSQSGRRSNSQETIVLLEKPWPFWDLGASDLTDRLGTFWSNGYPRSVTFVRGPGEVIVTLDVSAAIELVLKRPKHIPTCISCNQAEWVISLHFSYTRLPASCGNTVSWDSILQTTCCKTKQALKLVDEYVPPSLYSKKLSYPD